MTAAYILLCGLIAYLIHTGTHKGVISRRERSGQSGLCVHAGLQVLHHHIMQLFRCEIGGLTKTT